MNAKEFYNGTAFIYDKRHDNIYTSHLRSIESSIVKKYAHGRVIDIGGGTGYHSSWVNVDISINMLRLASGRRVLADANHLPFGKSFDTALIMFSVLNLTGIEIIGKVREVLRKGGTLIISYATPRDKTNGTLKRCEDDTKTIRILGKKLKLKLFCDLKERVEAFGFRHVESRPVFSFIRPIWNRSDKMTMRRRILFLLDRISKPSTGRMIVSVFNLA